MRSLEEDDEDYCWTCRDGEECDCDDVDYDGYCYRCGGSGVYIPSHCCVCGGNPYCNCCGKCGSPSVGRCDCPITVPLTNGATTTV